VQFVPSPTDGVDIVPLFNVLLLVYTLFENIKYCRPYAHSPFASILSENKMKPNTHGDYQGKNSNGIVTAIPDRRNCLRLSSRGQSYVACIAILAVITVVIQAIVMGYSTACYFELCPGGRRQASVYRCTDPLEIPDTVTRRCADNTPARKMYICNPDAVVTEFSYDCKRYLDGSHVFAGILLHGYLIAMVIGVYQQELE